MSFLKAEWRKLVLANYIVDEQLLEEYLPYGTELDSWKGRIYVSLVGFMFVNTKVLGLKIPFHTHFEEVNLRFYVRYNEQGEWKRGVVFIKEIVPRHAITFVANTIYKENYVTMFMDHEWHENEQERIVKYGWNSKGIEHSLEVVATLKSESLLVGSEEEFITEHFWGYAKRNDLHTYEYEVTHPRWRHYPVLEYKIDVDFGHLYGSPFAFLNDREPDSVMLAEGSEITVENRKSIK